MTAGRWGNQVYDGHRTPGVARTSSVLWRCAEFLLFTGIGLAIVAVVNVR
jgi:hypothetical protein